MCIIYNCSCSSVNNHNPLPSCKNRHILCSISLSLILHIHILVRPRRLFGEFSPVIQDSPRAPLNCSRFCLLYKAPLERRLRASAKLRWKTRITRPRESLVLELSSFILSPAVESDRALASLCPFLRDQQLPPALYARCAPFRLFFLYFSIQRYGMKWESWFYRLPIILSLIVLSSTYQGQLLLIRCR